MDKLKKIFLFITASLLVIPIYIVNAKILETTPSSNYKATCTKSIASKYGLDYEIGSNGGEFFITAKKGVFKVVAIEEGYYDQISGAFKAYPLTHLKGNVEDYINNKDAIVIGASSNSTGKAKTLKIVAKSFYDTRTQTDDEYVLRIKMALYQSDDLCQSPEDYDKAIAEKKNAGKFEEYLYIMLKDFDQKISKGEANTNYNLDECQTIRQVVYGPGPYVNVNNSIDNLAFRNLSQAGYNDYVSLVPFCFNSGEVVKNYTQKQVKSMVETAIQSSYAKRLPQTVTKDQDWVESEQRACAAVGGTWTGWGQCSATGENWQVLNKNQEPTVSNELYCKYEWQNLGDDDNSIGYKYTNINSYYAKSVEVAEDYYYYQYDGEEKIRDDQANKCTKVCEEVVDVEYGPPQAAIAGFCIEYQVKVTSHVKCTTSIDVHAPNEGIVCVPTPNCVHKTYKSTQAGPSEDFDACIKKCDNGEYTEACSSKCYNQVYKNGVKENLADNTNKTGIVTFVSNEIPSGGYYTREMTDNGYKIVWRSNSTRTSNKYKGFGVGTYAQWYIDNEYQRTVNDDERNGGSYFADGSGFKRKINGNTVCNGKCAYQNCGDDTYLTHERLQADYQENINRYNTIVNTCAAQATCTEKTAEFKIAAKVNGEWKSYPLNAGTDKLVSKNDNNERTENSIKSGSTLLSYAGCYDNGSQNNWYQAEWSFPGTWANNKTGEISYIDKSGDSTWHQTKNKFCLPLTLGNTNKEWWFYYMNMKSKTQTSSNKGSYISDEYKKTHPEIANQTTPPSKDKIDWNIKAQTMDFGYFHWKFNINCFYATYSQGNETKADNFTTRTIATNDMFPSTDPDDPSETRDSSQTGRTQGYNWTSAATISDSKNPYYAVNPEVLISKIQTLGKKVYDEENEGEYLEYEFRLTPEALRIIKKNNESTNHGNGNYTNWSDSFRYDSKKKIYIYTSELFRGSGANNISKYAYKLPSENLLGCNNISKNQCEANLGGN